MNQTKKQYQICFYNFYKKIHTSILLILFSKIYNLSKNKRFISHCSLIQKLKIEKDIDPNIKSQAPTTRKPLIPSNDAYEPPAAIQNAMLTKDKKPFTYTPGMGGKLDLSQIRSPRMARRVAKNANDEGIEGPPKSALESKPTPAPNTTNLFIQPQVAIPVFPTNIPAQPSVNRTPSTPPANRIQPSSKYWFIHFFFYSILLNFLFNYFLNF